MAGFKKSFDVESLRIGVVGAGSWGTALANLLALKGYKVDLWVFEQEVIEQIRSLTFRTPVSLKGYRQGSER